MINRTPHTLTTHQETVRPRQWPADVVFSMLPAAADAAYAAIAADVEAALRRLAGAGNGAAR